MKNTSLILSALALCAVVALGVITFTTDGKKAEAGAGEVKTDSTAQTGAIVYIDLDRIIMEYDMANDLGAVVETKVKGIQDEITRRGQKLEKAVSEYQDKMNKGLMTRSVAEAQYQKLQQQEVEFNNYAAQKQQEIQEEQVVMMNQIGDAIKTFLEKYNEEKQYAMIITNSGGAPVITAAAALNITDDVLTRLNEEYVNSKNEKNEKE